MTHNDGWPYLKYKAIFPSLNMVVTPAAIGGEVLRVP